MVISLQYAWLNSPGINHWAMDLHLGILDAAGFIDASDYTEMES
jgi:hypothetical protein